MKTTNSAHRLLQAFAVLGTMTITSSTTFGQEDDARGNALVGVWEEVVPAEVDCQTREPFGPTIRALLTFNQGGTMNAEDTFEAPTPIRSTGGGVWWRTAGRRYTYGNVHYEFDANKVFRLIIKQRSELTLSRDGRSFTENGTFEGLDPSGETVLFSGCFSATATRVSF